MARLSKSKIMSSLQCLKRVHLEIHRKDLIEYSPSTEVAFAIGHAVGDIAIQAYGGDEGVYIEYEGGLARAIRRTRDLMDGLFRAPVYEATLEHEGVLVREDVLLPVGDSWRIVEVKASTSVKAQHVQDCAIQAWVHQGAGYPLEGIALGYVNNQFVYGGDDDFQGLIIESDLTEQVADLLPSVPVWVENARAAVDGPMPDVAVGQHCFSPYECPFFGFCWPMNTEYPVHGLKGSRKKLGELVVAGYRDIRDVPSSELSAETQLRIRRVTLSGEAEVLPGAGEFARGLPYPRHYLDFETVGPAIPIWPGTRPYETLPFQYSCHIEDESGEIAHAGFLDMSGEPPMRVLAEKLIDDLGAQGPVLMYTAYEKGVIMGLAERFPDLADDLERITSRLVDLYPVTRQNYYHPDMLGSWSLKAVLPTIAPDMDYAQLEGVAEGNEASIAYLEAIKPGADPARVEAIRQELLIYCRHDTLAMVRLTQFFAGHS